MRRLISGFLTLILAACSTLPAQDPAHDPDGSQAAEAQPLASPPTQPAQPFRAGLEDYGPAPELQNEVWLNTGVPLRLADLRGKVVLLDMWTFG